MKKQIVLGTCSLALLLPATAWPDDQTTTNAFTRWATQDYLLGDWGGLRSDLARRGAVFEFFYIGSEPDNLAGGLNTGTIYQGLALATLDLDSQKLLGYEGGRLHASGLWLHGQAGFSANYSGDYNRVNLLDFPNALRLGELWYLQQLCQDHLSVKLGELSVDSDFIVPEYYSGPGQFTLLNQTFFYPSLPFNLFDPPGFPATGHGLATMPNAAPGAVIRWSPTEHVYAAGAIYSGAPDQSETGTRFNRNLTQLEIDGGLVYRGLIPTRNWDTLALAASYLEYSEDIRRAEQAINTLAPGSFTPVDYEGVIELSYKVQATAWWTIQPSVQHVFHPSGSPAIPGATVFILQTTFRF